MEAKGNIHQSGIINRNRSRLLPLRCSLTILMKFLYYSIGTGEVLRNTRGLEQTFTTVAPIRGPP